MAPSSMNLPKLKPPFIHPFAQAKNLVSYNPLVIPVSSPSKIYPDSVPFSPCCVKQGAVAAQSKSASSLA